MPARDKAPKIITSSKGEGPAFGVGGEGAAIRGLGMAGALGTTGSETAGRGIAGGDTGLWGKLS